MRSAYRALAHTIAGGVLLQAAFIAYGYFQTLSDVDGGKVLRKGFDENAGQELHSTVGFMVLPLLGLVLLVVAFLAKFDGAVKWAGYVLLAIVVQVLLALAASHVPAIGALHGLNAFVLLALAVIAGRRVATAGTAAPRANANVS
jgi:hypothetical protein